MKILTQHRQPNEWSCGPACCRALLNIHGFHYPTWEKAAEIAESHVIKGTSHKGIVRLLNAYVKSPFHVFDAYRWNRNDLRAALPAIVNYQLEGDGHYGILLGVKISRLLLWEPILLTPTWFTGEEFEKIWYSNRYGPRWACYLGD